MPLPKYRCHKVVEAFPIDRLLILTDGNGILLSVDNTYTAEVTAEYLTKHRPQREGYYVRYEDGYQSFSPAAAFEAGYTLIPDEATR